MSEEYYLTFMTLNMILKFDIAHYKIANISCCQKNEILKISDNFIENVNSLNNKLDRNDLRLFLIENSKKIDECQIIFLFFYLVNNKI